MAEFKDRQIRISNIPPVKVRYRLTNKPSLALLTLGVFGLVILETSLPWVGYIFLTLTIFFLFFIPTKTQLALTDEFLVYYLMQSDHECLIIYYQEVARWKLVKQYGREAYLLLTCLDEATYELNVMNPIKVASWLRQYLADKEIK